MVVFLMEKKHGFGKFFDKNGNLLILDNMNKFVGDKIVD